jgi:8-oxo-dGTP diphosphatase
MDPLIVTAAVIRRGRDILITRRKENASHPLLWEFPGGKLEVYEDPRDCIRREIKEELGIEVEAGEVVDVVYYRYPELPVLVIAYSCKWISGSIQNLHVSEHRWERPDQLHHYDFLPADKPLIDKLVAEAM